MEEIRLKKNDQEYVSHFRDSLLSILIEEWEPEP